VLVSVDLLLVLYIMNLCVVPCSPNELRQQLVYTLRRDTFLASNASGRD